MLSNNPSISQLRRFASIAFLGAILASFGDYLMLWKAVQNMPEYAHISSPPPQALLWGYYLGIIGIPLYALGYWAIAQTFNAPKISSVFFILSIIGVVCGTLIHGGAGIASYGLDLSGKINMGPATPLIIYADYLLPLVIISTAISIIGSLIYIYIHATNRSVLPHWWAWINPVFLIIILTIFALLIGGFYGQILTFAAPNIAHIFLFGLFATFAKAKQTLPKISFT